MSATTGNMFDLFKAQLLINQQDNMLYGFLILTIFEFVTGFLRQFFDWSKKYTDEYIKKKFTNKLQEAVQSKVEDKTAELFFERHFGRNDNWDGADAILMHVLKIPATQTVLVVGQLEIVKNKKEFHINDKVSFQLLELNVDKNGSLEHIVFRVFSKELTVCELRSYVEKLVEEYLIAKKNNLGNKTYYFDQIVEKVNSRVPTPKKLLFSKHLFNTNRTLDNVFHERQEEVKQRVNFFLNRKDWYDKRGIPHTLGLMLHGAPGTGKTSTIKAIANLSHRHIVNINFSAVKTKKQLKKLFYDERLEVCENMENTNNITEYIIPIDKRVFVIEDFDVFDSDLLLKRSARDQNNDTMTFIEPPKASGTQFTNEINPEDTADLDLSTVLNIIDGTLETPGRILIISSNFPEKLDEALIRPGRIDMLIEYKKCTHQMIKDMFASFFDSEPDSDLLAQIPEYHWTPAEVSQLLFKNFGDPDNAINELVNLDPIAYFKFDNEINLEPNNFEPSIPPTPVPEETPTPVEETPAPVEETPAPVEETPAPVPEEIPVPEGIDQLAKEIEQERSRAILDMMDNSDIQEMLGDANVFQSNTHQETRTLLNGYAPSESGYAFAGLS